MLHALRRHIAYTLIEWALRRADRGDEPPEPTWKEFVMCAVAEIVLP